MMMMMMMMIEAEAMLKIWTHIKTLAEPNDHSQYLISEQLDFSLTSKRRRLSLSGFV